jgi:hypothetical protein
MAGDWIKMRTDLYRDPKVCLIADMLGHPESDLSKFVNQNCQCDMSVTRNVTRNAVVGALVSVWGVLRHRGKREKMDLVVRGATLFVIDDLADLPGFGEAMEHVGWVVDSPEGLVLPHFFEEFNVDPSEEKSRKAAERQRRYREKVTRDSDVTRNVTRDAKSNAREEERREEIDTKTIVLVSGTATEKPAKVFRKPTVEDIAAYCRERGNAVDPQRFFDHYESNGWRVGKAAMRNWQASVRTWEKNENGTNRVSGAGVSPAGREQERIQRSLGAIADFVAAGDAGPMFNQLGGVRDQHGGSGGPEANRRIDGPAG